MFKILFFIVVLFTFLPASYAQDSVVILNGQQQSINLHGICARVTNSHPSGLSINVPVKTANEYTSFLNNLPAGVGVTTPCPSFWLGDPLNRGLIISGAQQTPPATALSTIGRPCSPPGALGTNGADAFICGITPAWGGVLLNNFGTYLRSQAGLPNCPVGATDAGGCGPVGSRCNASGFVFECQNF